MDGRLKALLWGSVWIGVAAVVFSAVSYVPAQQPAAPDIELPLPEDMEVLQPPPVSAPTRVPGGAMAGGQAGRLFGPRTELELIEFREMPLNEATRILSDQAGLKIVPSADAAGTIVSIYLRNVDALTALDALTKSHNLYYRQDRDTGIIRIYTAEEYQADLGSFREERTEVFTLLYPNPIDVALAIQGLYGTRVQLNFGSMMAGDSMVSQDLQQRFQRFSLLSAFNQLATGTQNGTAGTGANNGLGGGLGTGGGGFGGGGIGSGFGAFSQGAFGSILGGSNQFGQQAANLAQQTAELAQPLGELTPEQIQSLITASGDASPQAQAAIEELLRTRQTRIYVTVIPRNNQLIVRTSDETTLDRIRELVRELDVPTPLVLLEVKVMLLDLGDQFTSVFDYQFSDGNSLAGEFTTGNIIAPLTNLAAGPDRPYLPLEIGNAGAPGGAQDMTFQVVSQYFRARIQLLENNNRLTSLATPLLLTANNEVSQIFIGQQIPLVVGYDEGQVAAGGVGGNVAVQPSPETQLTNVGQSLMVTPNINADRTVTLRVAQQDSTVIDDGATIPVVDANGNIVELPIDVLDTRMVTGTVVAKDGLAVAMGGLINETLTDARAEVPVIGKLPVVGFFFRRQQTIRTRTELVVMIRPYVFNTPTESAMLSQELLADVSLHPNVPEGVGTLNSFQPAEVLRASAPVNKLQQMFRFHSLYPKTY